MKDSLVYFFLLRKIKYLTWSLRFSRNILKYVSSSTNLDKGIDMNKLFKHGLILALIYSLFVVDAEAYVKINGDFTLRASYYNFFNHQTRHIYSDGGPLYQIEYNQIYCDGFSVWGNLGYFSKRGEGRCDYNTKLRLYPVGMGFKYTYAYNCWAAYLGGGATYTFLNIRNVDPHLNSHTNLGAFGVVAKSGLRYNFFQRSCPIIYDYYYTRYDYTYDEVAYLELFVDYWYNKFNFSKSRNQVTGPHLDLSGMLYGLGFGVPF